LQSRCLALPGSLPIGLYWIHTLMGPPPLGSPAPQALLGLSSTWDNWIQAPQGTSFMKDNHIPTPLRPPSLGPCWASAPHETATFPTALGSLPLGLHRAPAPWQIYTSPGSMPLGPLAPQALPGPTSAWDDQIQVPPGSLPLGPCQACQITTPPGSHSGQHRRAPNLPKRHR
jgi:hypothetical protein